MSFRHLLLSIVALAIFHLGHTQEKIISLKKGEALDLLLLNTNKEAVEEREEYFSKAVEVAQKWGYIPQYSSRLKYPPTQGNYWPAVFILAKWTNYENRVKFTEDILQEYPQFHERRRTIWTTFNLTYWKVEKDQEIKIDPEKYYVATSYWSENNEEFELFKSTWSKDLGNQGGVILLELQEGESPYGYYYNPEFFTITEWESQEAFEKFYQRSLSMDHTGVKHVNQFILQ